MDPRLEAFLRRLGNAPAELVLIWNCHICSQPAFCPYDIKPGMAVPSPPISCTICGNAVVPAAHELP
jgi:hypothetical protein